MAAEQQVGRDVGTPLVGVDLVLVAASRRSPCRRTAASPLRGRWSSSGTFAGGSGLSHIGQLASSAATRLRQSSVGVRRQQPCRRGQRRCRRGTTSMAGSTYSTRHGADDGGRSRVEPPAQHAVGADRQGGGGVVGGADHPAATLVGGQLTHLALHAQAARPASATRAVSGCGAGGQRPGRARWHRGRGIAVEDEGDVLDTASSSCRRPQHLGAAAASTDRCPSWMTAGVLPADGARAGVAAGGEADQKGGGGEGEAARAKHGDGSFSSADRTGGTASVHVVHFVRRWELSVRFPGIFSRD